jgi:hypothetical protein
MILLTLALHAASECALVSGSESALCPSPFDFSCIQMIDAIFSNLKVYSRSGHGDAISINPNTAIAAVEPTTLSFCLSSSHASVFRSGVTRYVDISSMFFAFTCGSTCQSQDGVCVYFGSPTIPDFRQATARALH